MNVMLISLGCDKNLVDSEMMLGGLDAAGYTLTSEAEEADVIVVNTCCFIGDAKEESINTLIEYGRLKKEGRLKALIAAGCLAERYTSEIHSDLPEVDAVVGISSFDRIAEVIKDVLDGSSSDAKDDISRLIYGKKRMLSTGGHYAYLKIAEGCNKHCTYCVIPSVRGPYRSVPMEALIKEAEELVAGGVRELILVAQETTVYGTDLYGEKKLYELIEKLCAIEELNWVRLLYCYPEEIDDKLIEVMEREEKFCHYLDMPIQHSEDEILKRMGRKTGREEIESIVAKLRERIPDIALRTTLIAGFPGETKEQHEALKEFVEKMRFSRLGVFPYSAEEDTPAAAMEDQIDEEEKRRRADRVMELQQEIAFEEAAAMKGRIISCMVEGRIPENNVLVCRSYKDAPEVDGYVFVENAPELMSGSLMDVRITGSDEYDLIGEIYNESC
ncbi:MAG: 30S ribosomal protein S12 methylthiotransferase RimO [Lachnospiraceae bacterium]|nr:30S ribosomal protein S12 methylthiotransferase RimO [Lachnospiraceae bacterium]